MNTYNKYAPNVWLAKCSDEHKKGDIIEVENRFGETKEHIVHNLIEKNDEGFFFYSITRSDGENAQTIAQAKADRRNEWAQGRLNKATASHNAANEGRDFMVLGEPIKVGHHSERRHRALIERNQDRTRKAYEHADKAAEHSGKADYWEAKAEEINISMPESIEFFEQELEEAKEHHAKVKSGEIPRDHSFTLTYAKKKVNELEKKLALAKKLWG